MRLPDWIIIGAAKSGTTSLSAWLAKHPDVWATQYKELHYFDFDENHARGPAWYAEFFAEAGPSQKAGEATPNYLHSPEAPERVAALVPDATLLAVLRHPVDRAHSHYWHQRNWGASLPDFPTLVDAALAGDRTFEHFLTRGDYDAQLAAWTARGLQPKVHLFEDLAGDPQRVFAEVCDQIGVPRAEVATVGSVLNASHRRRSPRLRKAMERVQSWEWAPRASMRLDALNTKPVPYPAMPARTRDKLLERYADGTDRLCERLGRPLNGWST
ncbi:MAG: hypothetical protein JWL79_2429 [Frankiales bacterium]|nr:hypothetical protein [Frankiales bacterium]